MNPIPTPIPTLLAALAIGVAAGCTNEPPPSRALAATSAGDGAKHAVAGQPRGAGKREGEGPAATGTRGAPPPRVAEEVRDAAPERLPALPALLIANRALGRDAAPPPGAVATRPPGSPEPGVAAGMASLRAPAEPLDRERYAHFDDGALRRVAEHPVSTFGVDVDTGAYANVRRFLAAGRLPPRDAVRVEEMLNYFDYAYPAPPPRGVPFSVSTEIATTPWNPDTVLLQIGVKGREVEAAALPPANLVFLVDVSGSMNSPDKLPLLKSSLGLLVTRLRPVDRISLVVYAGASGVVLEPTAGDRKAAILAAIAQLGAGGSTNGAAGIRLAYRMAAQGFVEGGINRVLLATDGDFNVGTVNFDALLDLIERRRAGGVSLTTLGFGTGNYNDRLLERLADAGDGNYAYVDSLREAGKVLVEEMGSTLHTIARDVKIQVEFNPARVVEYRLLGYENRALRREDFSNDRVDAGEIGAGHTVTALYEVALAGGRGARSEPLRYAPPPAARAHGDELAFVRLRYKEPQGGPSKLIEAPLAAPDVPAGAAASERLRFAAAVAAFGQILRGGRYTGGFDLDAVLALARGARGADPHGYRGEFLGLVETARALSAPLAGGRGEAARIAGGAG